MKKDSSVKYTVPGNTDYSLELSTGSQTSSLQRYQDVARIGQEINQELTTVNDLFRILQKCIDMILDSSHTLLLAIYEPQTNTFTNHVTLESAILVEKGSSLAGACRYVIETQQSLWIRHLSKEASGLPFQVSCIPETRTNESLLFLPLTFRGISLGVLSIQHTKINIYQEEDLSLLQLLANHVALALHATRLYNDLSQFNEAGQFLTLQLDSEYALQTLVDKINHATKADLVVLYPYLSTSRHFLLPHIGGTLLHSQLHQLIAPTMADNIVEALRHHEAPLFIRESTQIYEMLGDVAHGQSKNFVQREQIRSTVAVPLRLGIEVVGVMFVNFRQPQIFEASQRLLINGLAHFAAIAIKNAQAFNTLTQRRVRELEVLQQIDREFNRTVDLEQVLNTLLKIATEQISADSASVMLYNHRLGFLKIEAVFARHEKFHSGPASSLRNTRSIQNWVLEHKQPIRVANIHQELPWRDFYNSIDTGMHSELDVPLLDGEDIIGILNFESENEDAFSQEDQDFLVTLSGQAVLAIKNAQAYDRERRLAEESQVLIEISKEITSQLDHVRIFDLILEKALAITSSTVGALFLYDPDLDDLSMVAGRDVPQEMQYKRVGIDQSIIGYAARTKQLCNVDPSQSPWNTMNLELIPGARSALTAPMLAGDAVRGVLHIESTLLNNFSQKDENLLKGLADLAVIALQNAESYDNAKREAQRFALLYQAGQELGKISELAQVEQAYDTIVRSAEQQSQSQVIIRRYDDNLQELSVIRASQSQQFLPVSGKSLGEDIYWQVVREKCSRIIYDLEKSTQEGFHLGSSDTSIHSLLVTPIYFNDRIYGTLELRHSNIGYFRVADLQFFEGLAQQLANTIYRLEAVHERQELEQRAFAAEEMSSIGQSSFELTHRLGNDLGLVESYVSDIRAELENKGIDNAFITRKLERIVRSVRTVLDLSRSIKQALSMWRDTEEMIGESIILQPGTLLEEASSAIVLPPTIQLRLDIDEDVGTVQVFPRLVTDIVSNLMTNAIDAMPEGGTLTLRARNVGRSVALDVIDTGLGISASQQSRIFDLFFSTKRSSGFGLWSARRNALKNNGDLKAQSQPGQGTTFTLLLPRANEAK